MRRTLFALATLSAALVALAPSATAAVAYSTVIDAPGDVARGTVVVRAHITGGVGDAEFAAYRAAGDWVAMERVSERSFASTSRPWSTEGLQNGSYQLEVRVWGDVPPYNPNEPSTYAADVATVSVDNAPPVPEAVRTSLAGAGVEVSWRAVPTSGRGDFLGYRILAGRAPSCTTASYREVAETSASTFTHTGMRAGTWCYRVVALRASTVSGEIASAPSAAAAAVFRAARIPTSSIPDAFGGIGATGARESDPPAPPALGDPTLEISDGTFDDRLPYGPQTITQQVEGRAAEDFRELSDEPGVGPRQAVTLVATGLVLATAALLLRRFLSLPPER